MKNAENIIKNLVIILLLLVATATATRAQYTLQDDDVTVTAGIITAATVGNVADYAGNTSNLTNIIIPDNLDGQTITGIEEWVFTTKGITSVNISGLTALTFYW